MTHATAHIWAPLGAFWLLLTVTSSLLDAPTIDRLYYLAWSAFCWWRAYRAEDTR